MGLIEWRWGLIQRLNLLCGVESCGRHRRFFTTTEVAEITTLNHLNHK